MCPRKASADHPGQELWTGFVSRPLDSGALSLFACFTGEGCGSSTFTHNKSSEVKDHLCVRNPKPCIYISSDSGSRLRQTQ